jgi:hypothetical protein
VHSLINVITLYVVTALKDKYTTLAEKRFVAISVAGDVHTVDGSTAAVGMEVMLAGVPGEVVTVTALRPASQDQQLAKTADGGSYIVVVKASTIDSNGFGKVLFN